ncbi:MAG TPA: flippase-like domain-containing protein [Baekduia sp.]|nr:flippase-like domain-containing protein [Baekduia sp.]
MAGATALPRELDPRRLRRRAATFAAVLGAGALVVALAPGLGDVRDELRGAAAGWLVVAVALEVLSSASYVLLFRPVFCRRMSWRASAELGGTALAVGSLLPASGIGGLAAGAWILHRNGMPGPQIARRSVAFFLIKGSVNFVAVAVLGVLLAAGVLGPDLSPWLTAVPAAMSIALITAVLALPRVGPGPDPRPGAPRLVRGASAVRRGVIGGVEEAAAIVRARDPLVLGGAVGYWAFDNAVLWATFQAVDADVALSVILFGYLIGQLGGLLPLPGGLGGMDGGLIGCLVVLGAPLAATTAAVLAYRVVLFWVPLLLGAVAFAGLRRDMDHLLPRRDEPAPRR